MKYVNRELKGTYGYIRKQTIFEIVKTLVMFAMAFGIFLIGFLTLGTKKSLWSVFAVLALLPASKSLVGVIMLARFRSLGEELYLRLSDAAGQLPALYENILTTQERTFFVPVICYASGDLIAYNEKDAAGVKEHLDKVFAAAGTSVSVKVFSDEAGFEKRARQMAENLRADTKYESVFNTIKAVSL
ncbi:MAG: hypothetical protein J5367_06305 [Lachnospiraceae bacterium]|nr:hypothetical protein [Lachnospiraceae bacterium]